MIVPSQPSSASLGSSSKVEIPPLAIKFKPFLVWANIFLLVPGVVDTTTNFIEHPELVAQRISKFVNIVGKERVIAGSDCGFGTFAGFGAVDPDIAFAKLKSLSEGALLASN